jgi:(4S)-4-hydroxy-5-phosphonooxypentane-2,3-dione isomerase
LKGRDLIDPAGFSHSNSWGGVEVGSDAEAYPVRRNRLSLGAKAAKAPHGAIGAPYRTSIRINREDRHMIRSVWISAAAITLFAAGAMLLSLPAQRAAAQSPGMFVNAVDYDIAPAERDNFLAALTENGKASVTEPGCRVFNVQVLASDPNHVFIYEVYDNEAAAQAHRATDHFKKYAATTAKMVVKREVRPMSIVAANMHGK